MSFVTFLELSLNHSFETRGHSVPLAIWVKFSADDILKYFFLIFPGNRIWHFMQVVSTGDNLHEMSIPVFR